MAKQHNDRTAWWLLLPSGLILAGLTLFFGWFYLWGTIPGIIKWLRLQWPNVVLSLVIALLLFRILRPGMKRVWLWLESKYRDSPLKVVELVVVSFASIGGVFTVALQIISSQEDAKAAREASLYIGAVEQLASGEDNDPPVAARLWALATLEKVMQEDSYRYHNEVLRVVAAYIRHNSREPCQDGHAKPSEPEGCSPLREDVNRALSILIERRTYAREEQISLSLAQLPGVDMRGVDMRNADLWRVNLREADMRKAELQNALLGRTDLREVDLRDANLVFASLAEADLRGAYLADTEGLSSEELVKTYVDIDTVFPDGSRRACVELFERGFPIHKDDNTCPKAGDEESGYVRSHPS